MASAIASTAFIALGSNLGDRLAQLAFARSALGADPSMRERGASAVYETPPVGPAGQGPYLNAVLSIETTCSARALLDRLLDIERSAGRDRASESVRWGPRVLDLDLLLFGDLEVDEDGLEVPHPRLHERAFVLVPLCDVGAEVVHPRLGDRMADWLSRCEGREGVRPFDGRPAWVPSWG